MKKLLLLPIFFTATAVWGAPCTTAVGSAHVIATCALGDRTFSAFATIPGTTHLVGSGPASRSETGVLVPFSKWSESARESTPAGVNHENAPTGAILEVLDSRTSHRARTQTERTVVGERQDSFRESTGGLPIEIYSEKLDAVPLETGGSDDRVDEESLPTILIVPPDFGVEENGRSTGKAAVVSLDTTEPGDHLTETPEPAAFTSIGSGLIALWFFGHRTMRRPKSY